MKDGSTNDSFALGYVMALQGLLESPALDDNAREVITGHRDRFITGFRFLKGTLDKETISSE